MTTGIANGYGFSAAAYQDQQPPLDGSPALSVRARPRANPLVAQFATLTFGGTPTNGVYSQAFTGPDGTTVTVSVTRAAGVPATNALLAAAAVAAIAADDAWANVATAEVNGGTPEQVDLTWLHPGDTWAIGATAAPGAGTLVPAITTAAGGSPVPVGRFLISVPNPQDPEIEAAGLPLTGSTAAQIIGLSARDGSVENSGLPGAAQVESIPAGSMISSGEEGGWYMTNHGTVATVDRGQVFVVVNPAGGQLVGQARSNADGGNTVGLSVSTQAYWLDAGIAPGERGRIFLKGL